MKFAHLLLQSIKTLTNHEFRAQVIATYMERYQRPSPKRAKSGAADPVQTDTERLPRTPSGAGHDKRRETLVDV
ncbi:hypothetical protein E4U39_005348 [Claviceps sp. Clav50 group G5]|nr:hypothetical protein E4U39_005348 [Claviceps sp. Clav50 group G5]